MQLEDYLGYLPMRAKVLRKTSYTEAYVADKDHSDKFCVSLTERYRNVFRVTPMKRVHRVKDSIM